MAGSSTSEVSAALCYNGTPVEELSREELIAALKETMRDVVFWRQTSNAIKEFL